MAINPVQLVGQNRQMPDFVGQFMRGRQEKRQGEMFDLQKQQAEEERQAMLEQKAVNFFGRAGDILANTPPEEQAATYNQFKALAQANMRPTDVEDMPEEFAPEMLPAWRRQALLKGYAPPGAEFDKYYQTEDGGLIGVRGNESVPVDLNGARLSDRTPRTEVNIDNKAEGAGMTKEQEALAQTRVNRYNQLRESALAAEEQNAGIDQLANIDVNTGFGEGAKSQISRVVNAMGGNGEAITGVDPANVQAFNAVTGKMVLDVMASQKGPQTDKDQARIAATLPNIANEQHANKFNMNALKGLNLRKIEQAEFYERFLEENDGTLKGADTAWSKFKRETPLLSDNVKNPETGLPMFYHQFREKLLERNPGATEEQAIKAWRKLAN